MKYIEAEKLINKINKLRSESCISESDDYYEYAKSEIIDIIASLQQEQPEVNLEKEIDNFWNPRFNLGWDDQSALSMNHEGFVSIACHFYELGLNARKEE